MQISQSQVSVANNQVPEKSNQEPVSSDQTFNFDNHLISAQQNIDLFDQQDSSISKSQQHRQDIEDKRNLDDTEKNDELAMVSQTALIKASEKEWKSESQMAKSSIEQSAIQEKVSGQKARYRTPTIQENGTPEQINQQESGKTELAQKSQKADANLAEIKFDDIQNQTAKKGMLNIVQEMGKNAQFKYNQNPVGAANNSIISSNLNQSSLNQQMNKEGSAFGKGTGKLAVKSGSPVSINDNVGNTKQFQSVLQSKQTSAARSDQLQMQQIVDKVKMMLSSNKSEMIIKLSPEHLGKLEVRLKKVNDGMTGILKVENQMVKEALEPQLAELQQTLEQQGVKLDDISILVNDQSNQENMFAGFENQANSDHNFETGTQNASIKPDNVNVDEVVGEKPVISNTNNSGMSIYA